MSVCICVKQQTGDLKWFVIVFHYSFICGWNSNVAIKIVAGWNWNVFTSSSWLDRHGEFVFTIHHVRCDPPHSNSPFRSSILWVRVWRYRLADLISSVKVNLFDMFPCCCCCSAMAWSDAVWGFGRRTVGGARGGDWVVLTSHFYGSQKGSWKITTTLCRLCELYCRLTVLKLKW